MRWRIGFGVAAIGILVALLAASAPHDPESAALLARGDAYRDQLLYTAAIDQYLQALGRDPNNSIALLRLCDAALLRGQTDEAAAYADRAEVAGADRIALAECRARLSDALGRPQDSAANWAIVADARPEDRAARLDAIEAMIAAHDWPAATEASRLWWEANPSDSSAAFYFGALLALDDPAQARSILQAANTPAAKALLSALSDPVGEIDRAYRDVSLGRVFLGDGQAHLAWRALADATASNPGYADAFAYLGAAYAALGDRTLAAAHFDRALELDAQSIIGLYLRGVFLSGRGAWAGARADLEQAAQLDPTNASIAAALGRVLAEQGDYLPAEDQLVKATTLDPNNAAWQLALAEFYIGRLIRVADEGVAAAQRAVDLAPDDASAHDWFGWGLYLAGSTAPGEAELRAALRLDPVLARARLHLGNLLIDIGRIEEGRTELQRAVDLDPKGEAGARARQLLGNP